MWRESLKIGRKSLLSAPQTQQLSPGYTKNSKNLMPEKIINPINKWAKELNKYFTEEEIWMVKNIRKKCSTSLAIGEKQMKLTLRFHLIPVRMAIIKNINNNKYWQECGKEVYLYIAGGTANWCNHSGKQYRDSLYPKCYTDSMRFHLKS